MTHGCRRTQDGKGEVWLGGRGRCRVARGLWAALVFQLGNALNRDGVCVRCVSRFGSTLPPFLCCPPSVPTNLEVLRVLRVARIMKVFRMMRFGRFGDILMRACNYNDTILDLIKFAMTVTWPPAALSARELFPSPPLLIVFSYEGYEGWKLGTDDGETGR